MVIGPIVERFSPKFKKSFVVKWEGGKRISISNIKLINLDILNLKDLEIVNDFKVATFKDFLEIGGIKVFS